MRNDPRMRRVRGFTLIEIMIVVLIIGILIGMAVPNFITARENGARKTCMGTLKQIDSAKQEWAMDNKKSDGDACAMADIAGASGYIKAPATGPSCPLGGAYTVNPIGANPTCSLSGAPHQHLLP